MSFVVSQMNSANVIACTRRVALMFMTFLPDRSCRRSAERSRQRVGEGEEHGYAKPDDERGVDQAKQQEHLDLQRVGELRLARRGLQKAAAHDAHADASPRGAESDHQADADAGVSLHHRQQLKLFHWCFPFPERKTNA